MQLHRDAWATVDSCLLQFIVYNGHTCGIKGLYLLCFMISGVPGWDLGEVSELLCDREKPGHIVSLIYQRFAPV